MEEQEEEVEVGKAYQEIVKNMFACVPLFP